MTQLTELAPLKENDLLWQVEVAQEIHFNLNDILIWQIVKGGTNSNIIIKPHHTPITLLFLKPGNNHILNNSTHHLIHAVMV